MCTTITHIITIVVKITVLAVISDLTLFNTEHHTLALSCKCVSLRLSKLHSVSDVIYLEMILLSDLLKSFTRLLEMFTLLF